MCTSHADHTVLLKRIRFVGYRTTRNKRPENSSERSVPRARFKPEIPRKEKHHFQSRLSYTPFITNQA